MENCPGVDVAELAAEFLDRVSLLLDHLGPLHRVAALGVDRRDEPMNGRHSGLRLDDVALVYRAALADPVAALALVEHWASRPLVDVGVACDSDDEPVAHGSSDAEHEDVPVVQQIERAVA